MGGGGVGQGERIYGNLTCLYPQLGEQESYLHI